MRATARFSLQVKILALAEPASTTLLSAGQRLVSLPGMSTPLQARSGDRRRAAFQARLTWRDASGAMRFASVVTRNVSDTDVFVECQMPTSIPLYRLVHLQLERGQHDSPDVPVALRAPATILAIWPRVALANWRK